MGLLANGLFGDADIVALDDVTQIEGGWLNHNWCATRSINCAPSSHLYCRKQLYKQVAYIFACSAYSACTLYPSIRSIYNSPHPASFCGDCVARQGSGLDPWPTSPGKSRR